MASQPPMVVARAKSASTAQTRAEPAASQANVGNVDVLQAHWTEPLLNELRSFCGDPRLKDDQVDALSRAFARLSQPQYMTRIKIF